jgi:hypothetical protein
MSPSWRQWTLANDLRQISVMKLSERLLCSFIPSA